MKQQAAIVIATLAIGAALAAILVMRKTSVRSESEPATRRLLSSWITNLSKSNRRGEIPANSLRCCGWPQCTQSCHWSDMGIPISLSHLIFCQRELQSSAEFSQ